MPKKAANVSHADEVSQPVTNAHLYNGFGKALPDCSSLKALLVARGGVQSHLQAGRLHEPRRLRVGKKLSEKGGSLPRGAERRAVDAQEAEKRHEHTENNEKEVRVLTKVITAPYPAVVEGRFEVARVPVDCAAYRPGVVVRR